MVHPVLEQLMPEGSFVPNSIQIGRNNRIHILTGPYGGKSHICAKLLRDSNGSSADLLSLRRGEIGIAERIFVLERWMIWERVRAPL